jgi:hypothetical protein
MIRFVIRDYTDKDYDSYFKQWVIFANSFERAKELIGGSNFLSIYTSRTVTGTNKERILKYFENNGYKNNK